MAASTMAPMWDRWNRQATRCAAGPPTHAHYVPAPSGHLGQCFSLGVLLEPEDSCLGCGQRSYSLMFLPPSLSFCLLTHHHQGHRKLFLVWGNPTPIVFFLFLFFSSTNPLTTAFQSYCKASKFPQQRISEYTEVKKNFWLFLLPSLPEISLRQ